ncbi:MAG: L-ribulose-5-phosphate 4-epimerase [Clostridiales bacterium]|nr:L-ribulose-5-phosphate 4-epimerase [Oscillospiraceae bacterium]MDD5906627.1 L-ribulose-5-phosphate 4-epimerase [Clostridiales bacterium]
MLEALKQKVLEANLKLKEYNLVVLTWGNVSALSDDRKYVVIKPSGVDYAVMTADQMVVTDLDGNVVEGNLRPSSDLPTHIEIYKNFQGVGGIVHTHSRYATAFAQAEQELPCYGTTHADHFYGTVPCTRHLLPEEIESGYEINTGKVIVETFRERHLDPLAVPAVLVCKHGPFTWGSDMKKAVENALVLDETAHMAILSMMMNPSIQAAPQYLQDKHYFRKHGANAYYGQTT